MRKPARSVLLAALMTLVSSTVAAQGATDAGTPPPGSPGSADSEGDAGAAGSERGDSDDAADSEGGGSESDGSESVEAGEADADSEPDATEEADLSTDSGLSSDTALSEGDDGSGPGPAAPTEGGRIRYFLENVVIEGNTVTRDYVVRRFVPLRHGDVLDVDDPEIEAVRWRLLGTGYFDAVDLRLSRGTRRGWVDLVIDVEERNTLVIQQIAFGLSQAIGRTDDMSSELLPYGGLTVAETNLLGLGMELSVSLLASKRQQGVRLRWSDPAFLASDFLVSSSAFFNNGLEFFGDDPLVAVDCPEPTDPMDECPPEVEARNAVVFYRRFGGSLGIGHDLGTLSSITLEWYGEVVDVGVRPSAASELRGLDVDPIDFAIQNGMSFVSTLRLGLTYDRRDDPGLTSDGLYVRFEGTLGTRLIGSDYSFLKMQAQVQHWVPLPWARHHIRFSVFAGAIFGDAPFFHRFYASDLSDLIPSRVLLMNIDDRPPPNLFGTSIVEMRSEELAARLDIEYAAPLYRGSGGFRAVDAYFSVGVYTLADRRDLVAAIPGYEGFSRMPLDLTFDLGVRADTSIGMFQAGFSTLLGFVPIFAP